MFKNRLLRRIFEPKKEEVIGGWKELFDDLDDLYSSVKLLRCSKRKNEINGTYSKHGRKEKCIQGSSGDS